MSLTPGTRLGPYEIVSAIGAGGMGEVYRAKDTKLNRDVAIKVLPESFALDADRVARFTREAQVLASLNHPNIAAIYGIEEQGSTRALVMELVEGEDLSAHIARGAISIVESLPIAKQIADALEAAHEQGIVHRDLKPQNIKLRADGTVKVLDFGLAKAMDPAGASSSDAMNSPTMTVRATQMGMIIGTAAYMAPEQARGRAVDRRADIWSFGVVLYEMLSGQRCFEGEDISITLASVLKEDVKWHALPADLPAPLQRLLRRCLEKDPKRRLSWIGEARLALEDNATADAAMSGATATVIQPLWRRAVPWAIAAIGLGAATLAVALWAPWRTAPAPSPLRLLTHIGVNASLVTTRGPAAVLSPDGTMLAFAAQQTGQPPRLYVRRLEELQATLLAGTDGADLPFFSPNGQQIAFFAGGELKKVAITGGAVRRLCAAPTGRGGTWTDDDTIIFTPSAGANAKLMRVSAEGGQPSEFGTFGEGMVTQRWPQALPDGTHVLYTENATTVDFELANIVVAPLDGGAPKVVVRGAYGGRYVQGTTNQSRTSGHLTYIQQGALYAVPFDLTRLEPVGKAAVVAEGVAADSAFGSAQIAYASNGTLVYTPGRSVAPAMPVQWIARDGKVSTLRAEVAHWSEPRFAPNGLKLAMVVSDDKRRDIWVYDIGGDRMTQLTTGPGIDRTPVWSSDSKRIVFSSDRAKPGGPTNIYMANADGTGDVTRLTDSPNTQVAFSWHPNQAFVFFQELSPTTGWDLMVLSLKGSAATGWTPGLSTVFLNEPGAQLYPQVSPDGRWIAYYAPETTSNGSINVWVRPFPGPVGKWRVSEGVGRFAKWSPASRELLFVDPNTREIKVAPYTVDGAAFQPGKVTTWSPTMVQQNASFDSFAIHPDGKRLAGAAAISDAAVSQTDVVFVFNFADYLHTIAPVKR